MKASRVVLVLVAVAGLAVVGWYLLRDPKPDPVPPSTQREPTDGHPHPYTGPALDPDKVLFRESADAAGLTWRMRFLPNEQGETFKINLYDHGCGVAVGDFDGDGRDDIYFVNLLGPNALYRNNGDGTFADVAAAAGVALGDRVCVAAAFADYDNDGRQDLYVTSTRGGNVLFHNNGNGTFTDATEKAGLKHIGHSQTPAFFDYDNDGRLDLFLANTAEWTTNDIDPPTRAFVGKGFLGDSSVAQSPVQMSTKESNVLYRNNGNGTFTDVTGKAGLKGRGWAGDAIAFDYDGDGWMDLFVTCMFGRCQLYHNERNGTFTDVTLEVLGRTPWGGVGATVFDSDNNGLLDLFVLDMHSDMWTGADFNHDTRPLALKHERHKFMYMDGPNAETNPLLVIGEEKLGRKIGFKSSEVLFGNGFYRNRGGKFEEVSDKAGLETFWPWGAATGDFDNDGHEDVFIPAGMGYPFYYWPNSLMMNSGDGAFADRSNETGIEPPPRGLFLPDRILGKPAARSSRCAATGDFTGDGRVSIVVNNFNDQPYFFRNQGAKRNFISFKLIGTRCNRDAIGAVVRIYRGDRVLTRQVLGAAGYLSQSSRTLHVGLGDSAAFDRVEVTWPGGRVQKLDGLKVNSRNDITEAAK